MIVSWEDPRVQRYVRCQLSRWYSMLGGYIDRDDIVQEVAIVFLSVGDYVDDERGEDATIAYFKRSAERRVIDLQRRFVRRRLVAPVDMRPGRQENDDPDFGYEPADDSPSEDALALAVGEADGSVRALLDGCLSGSRRTGPDGRLESLDAFTRRVAGDSWRRTKPALLRWAEKSLCVGV